ncbi:MAG: endolytic transglycosylase MltG [Clostridiales bacterium]|nr:endolytic transglycosylase MltG [Clostridiales bacterium]
MEIKNTKGQKTWKRLRPFAAGAISVGFVLLALFFGVHYVLSRFVYPVDTNDATPYEIVIPNNASAGSIAQILYTACGEGNKGLIVSTASFKVYVDFMGKAGSLRAGTYILSKNMSIGEIVNQLCQGSPPQRTLRFTVPEGSTVEAIATILVEKGIIAEESTFLTLAGDAALFSNYTFVNELENRSERRYLLEGYLFPDTYEVYVNASAEDVIVKMLTRCYGMYTDELVERAEELHLTRDQVMTLASIIEREAADPDDFAKVSAVFHNRMKDGMPLESCATLSYALGLNKYTFTKDEMDTVSPFNTYRNKNLPIGPICNPGMNAIYAALYPNEDFLAAHYLFFCNANPAETRSLLFSKTYEEHQKLVREYQQYWD